MELFNILVVQSVKYDGGLRPGRPRMTWKILTENNCHE